MKQSFTLLIGFVAVASTFCGYGQQVSFEYHPALLNPVSGFTVYADCAVDMDANRLDDVVRVGSKGLYIDFQMPDGIFRQEFFPVPIESPPTWSVCAGDLDNNGLNDLLFADTETISIVRALANGTSYSEDVMPVTLISQRATMADIDNDGWLDAFVCNDTAMSIPVRNLGFGQMIPDTTLIKTSPLPGSYGAIWTDYDNDNDIDLYISKCLSGASPGDPVRTNLLYQNQGNGVFAEIATQANVDDNAQSWTSAFEDFDNDGDMDAFVINHDDQNRLFRNNGDGTFTDVIAGSGLTTIGIGVEEIIAADFNNDGHIDIFSDLDDELFLGNGDLTFTGQDAPTTPGAIADLNHDGFLDITKNGQVWLNTGNTSTHWVRIFPVGRYSNMNGIGARVEIYGAWGIQIREVRSGQSYSPMSSLVVHFGLGPSEEIDSLVVRWPSGVHTVVKNLQVDTTYALPETGCVFFPAPFLPEQLQMCPDDTIILEAPAGYARYQWTHGDTTHSVRIHAPGHYSVALTDSLGCAGVSPVTHVVRTIDEAPGIYAEQGILGCTGDTITLISTGGTESLWSTGEAGETIDVTLSGTYTVSVDAACSGDQLSSEPVELQLISASQPVVSDIIHGGGDTVIVSAVCDTCFWFDLPDGGNLLASGSTLTTSGITDDTVFYVENRLLIPGEVQSGGKQDTTGGGISEQTGFMRFEAWEPFVLHSVKVFLHEGASLSPRFIQLFSQDTLLAVRQFQLDPGWNDLILDFDIPVGKMSLHCPQGNLFRDAGNLEYPYPIGSVGRIETSSFGDGYYYYFYDWKIVTMGVECISPRIAVSVTVSDLSDQDTVTELKVFPVPARDAVTITLPHPGRKAVISLYDIQGRLTLATETNANASLILDLSEFANGLYWLQIQQDDLISQTRIILIQ